MPSTTVPPFGAGLYLATRPREWRKLRREFDALEVDAPTLAGQTNKLVSPQGHLAVVVYLDPRHASDEAELVDTVAHEAAHVAAFVLEHVGETERTFEVEPYLVGWVAGWLWRQL